MADKVRGLREVFSKEEIKKMVAKMAAAIKADYQDLEHNLIVVGSLKGAVFFFADLCMALNFRYAGIDFIKASSYGDDTKSSMEVKFDLKLKSDIKGRDILLVEDVVDSGLTLKALREYLLNCGAKSVKSAVLVDKRERRITDVKVDYSGFLLKEGFIVGYGLDLAESYRMMPAIYEVIFESS